MEYRQRSQGERHAIASMLRDGYGRRQMARALERSVSMISRELKRNRCEYDRSYRARKAQERALRRRWRSRQKSPYSLEDWAQVRAQLHRKWSPQQIAGRRVRQGHRTMSKATICRYVRRDRREGGQLWKQLRIMSQYGRKRRGSPATRGRLVGKRHISQRPKSVQDRRRVGHWEGDTVMGADQRHCVLTVVERKTRHLVLKKLQARSKEQAARAQSQAAFGLGARMRTVTLDNGMEFHDDKTVEMLHRVKYYFATPYHSWERGTNENTNGLIRQ